MRNEYNIPSFVICSAKNGASFLQKSFSIFIFGFCILLRAIYQGYWKNRLSQQLFKVYIYLLFISINNILYYYNILINNK
jgi:hypothetical protein